MAEPPYLRIASELRRRISSGELRAGARAPSSRQLQKKWGVALVTASKALTTLTREGLLRAEPRVGYVVVAPVTRRVADTSERGGALSRDRIVRAAIEIADVEGLGALSMRGVAAKIAVPTMSLYRHVQDRDALLMWMVDAVFAEKEPPPRAGRGWRELLEVAARVQWALYRRHPWLPQIMSLTRPMAPKHVVIYADWVMAAMDGLPIDAATKLYVHMTLYSYVRGVAINIESERQAEAETGMTDEQWTETHGPSLAGFAQSEEIPAFARMLSELGDGFSVDLDAVFEFGLQPLLDGLAKVMAGKTG